MDYSDDDDYAEEVASEITEQIDSVEGSQELSYQESFYSAGGSIDRDKNSILKQPAGKMTLPLKENDGKPKKSTGNDDYSMSFEEIESALNGTNYSNDFEDVDQSPMSLKKSNQRAISNQIPSRPVETQQQLPSLGLQALQAELSLQKLSEEVIQLRNKQRNLLKERWQQVKEKKSRADVRRQQHLNELAELRQKSIDMASENQQLRAHNESLEAALKAAQGLAEVHVTSSNRLMAALDTKDKENAAIMNLIKESEAKIAKLELEALERNQELVATKDQMKSEISRRDVDIQILIKTNEANDARIAKERENLPEYHNKIAKEKLDRLTLMEAELKSRDELNQSQLLHRQSMIELQRTEAMDEVQRYRERMELKFSEERQHLDRLRLEYSSQETRQAIAVAESKAAADAHMAEAKRLSAETNEALQLLRRQEAEFSIRQKMMEPLINAAEHDRDSARSIKRDAQQLFEQSNARETAVIAAEVGLRAREAKADVVMTEARQLVSKCLQDKSKIESDDKSVALQKSLILKERFRLHRCSSELMKQMALLKRGIYDLTRVSNLADVFSSGGKKMKLLSNNRNEPIEINQTDLIESLQDNRDYEVYRENHMNYGNKDKETSSMETKRVFVPQPLLMPLLREFEDATERLHIISEELALDPFQISDEKPSFDFRIESAVKQNTDFHNPINASSNESLEIPSRIETAVADGRVATASSNREILHMAMEPINYSEIRVVVDSAASSFHSLKEIAKSYGV